MSFRSEHPDYVRERWDEAMDERARADARRDRIADHTPAGEGESEQTPTRPSPLDSPPSEYPCPRCGRGAFTIRDNSDAPIPIRVPPSVHDDEGRSVSFCPWCDEELNAETLGKS